MGMLENGSPDYELDFDSDTKSGCPDDELFQLDDDIQKLIESEQINSDCLLQLMNKHLDAKKIKDPLL